MNEPMRPNPNGDPQPYKVIERLRDENSKLRAEIARLKFSGIKPTKEDDYTIKHFEPIPDHELNQLGCVIRMCAVGWSDRDCMWANSLLRMYQRFSELKEWDCDVVDALPGRDVGIQSATLTIKHAGAFARLKQEDGIHGDCETWLANSRQALASVLVAPLIPLGSGPEIPTNELKMEVFKSKHPDGGTAVRVTHLPTGIHSSGHSYRTEESRSVAMGIIRSLVYKRKIGAVEAANSLGVDPSWNCVSIPTKIVRRYVSTAVEFKSILDGDLDLAEAPKTPAPAQS